LNHATFGPILWVLAVWIDLTRDEINEFYSMLHMYVHHQFQRQIDIMKQAETAEEKLKTLQAKYLALGQEVITW
jgi:hypothetical protein